MLEIKNKEVTKALFSFFYLARASPSLFSSSCDGFKVEFVDTNSFWLEFMSLPLVR